MQTKIGVEFEIDFAQFDEGIKTAYLSKDPLICEQDAKEILDDFENKINNFKQVCPVEMLYKLENPITLKGSISKAV